MNVSPHLWIELYLPTLCFSGWWFLQLPRKNASTSIGIRRQYFIIHCSTYSACIQTLSSCSTSCASFPTLSHSFSCSSICGAWEHCGLFWLWPWTVQVQKTWLKVKLDLFHSTVVFARFQLFKLRQKAKLAAQEAQKKKKKTKKGNRSLVKVVKRKKTQGWKTHNNEYLMIKRLSNSFSWPKDCYCTISHQPDLWIKFGW